MHPHLDGDPSRGIGGQAGGEGRHAVYHPQSRPHGPLRVVLLRLGIAKVDQQSVPPILGNVAGKALDNLGAVCMKALHHGVEVFRVELTGEAGGICQGTGQHRQQAS